MWLVSHTEISVQRAVQQVLTLSKPEDVWLWKENRRSLKEETARNCAEIVQSLNLQQAGFTFASSVHMYIVDSRSNNIIYIPYSR